jgi:hypothetical protein
VEARPPTEAAFYRLKRAKYLVCNNIYDATLKIIAMAKVKANMRLRDAIEERASRKFFEGPVEAKGPVVLRSNDFFK